MDILIESILMFLLTISLGVIIFIVLVESSFYNKPTLKFHNDEIDISDVKFHYRNILKENKYNEQI